MVRLSQPALVTDNRGQVVEVPGGDVYIQGVYSLHGLGMLAAQITDEGHPHIEIIPLGFVQGLDGREELVCDLTVLPGAKPGPQGEVTLQRISRESVGTAPPSVVQAAPQAHAGAQP